MQGRFGVNEQLNEANFILDVLINGAKYCIYSWAAIIIFQIEKANSRT